MTLRRLSPVLVLTLACAFPAAAQGKPKKLAEWTPEWKVGDWWTVQTYQKDMKRRLTSPKPVRGGAGEPRLPSSADGPAVPGFPPLRNGVPKGYKLGNLWRFEIVRKETVRFDDGPPIDTPPETFWVVEAKTTQGTPTRVVELWYSTEDLVLSKLVVKAPKGSKRKDRVRWTKGTAQLQLPETSTLALPLSWPDFKAAKQRRTRFEAPRKTTVEQRVRRDKPGTKDERNWILLQQVTKKRGQAKERCVFQFEPGKPFWTRMEAGMLLAEMKEHGRKK